MSSVAAFLHPCDRLDHEGLENYRRKQEQHTVKTVVTGPRSWTGRRHGPTAMHACRTKLLDWIQRLGLHLSNCNRSIIKIQRASNGPGTVAGQSLEKLLYQYRKRGGHTGWDRYRREDKNRHSSNCLRDSQGSLELQRDWIIHQAQDISHLSETITPPWT